MKLHVQPGVSARILALALLAVSLPPAAHGEKFKVIYAFTGGADGGVPLSGLSFDTTGNLYGTTVGGGDAGCFNGTCGVIFELTRISGGWSESALYTFTGGSDGGNPQGSLILDAAGNLYGTAQVGGDSCGQTYGCGVAFELAPDSGGWTETVLYSFHGGAAGFYPVAALALDKHGNLYSTIANGGRYGSGSAYELTNDTGVWKEKVLYSFNGWEPEAAVILDAAGNLYSTAPLGSTVWELLHGSWKEKTLYDGGGNAWAGLVFDKAGNLYGTTILGGKYGMGSIFELAPGAKGKWKAVVLHSFKGGSDGDYPRDTLVFDKAGNLYGTTYNGGGGSACGQGCGTVFKLTRGSGGHWKETILHRFTAGNDGAGPLGLTIDGVGNLYGTTVGGGNVGCYDGQCGVVFEITP